MAEALKNMFSPQFVEQLANELNTECGFPVASFRQMVMDANWHKKELKERSHHIASCFNAALEGSYANKLQSLFNISNNYSGYIAIVFADFVELFGLDHWEESMVAHRHFTQRCTAEFAVRPFLLHDLEKMMKQHEIWSKDENHHVRRLASEGIRPRLPWGKSVPRLKKEPELILPILQNLVEDESEYVRRSVANNLNDITKDFPDLVLDFVKQQNLENKDTQRLVKHALRGLLKKGHPEALALFGFGKMPEIHLQKLTLHQKELKIGESLDWEFELEVSGKGNLRLEYHVHFVKANGSTSPKVFQLSESKLDGKTRIHQKKKHHLKDLTTRKHYPEEHRIALVINGQVVEESSFFLLG